MFVSKKDATERLNSRDNVFRDKSIPLPPSDLIVPEIPDGEVLPVSTPKKQEAANEVDHASLEDDNSLGRHLDVDEGAEDLRERDSFAKLDALIHPQLNGRANYKGKLQSQIGIGEVALMIGQKNAGDLFGLSRPQAEAYAHGLDTPNQLTGPISKSAAPRIATRKAHLENLKEIVAEKAAVKLSDALDILTTDKIKRMKGSNVVRAAKDLSTIVRNMEGEKAQEESVHFHIYRPEIRQENHYETINVGPKV